MSSKHEDAEPVVIAQPASEVEGAILRGALEAAGIPAWVVGGLTAGFRAEAPGRAKLLVRACDAERARRVLEHDVGGDEEHLDDED
ncbi:MAG: DUF2007 domain-containing protein [Phycisphaerales bacterium]|nr:DUF2007 domain-containing protein [Phycisphaerales bacterium]